MTRWRPSSPAAEAPGQWGSAWTYAYPAQARIDALRRLLGGGPQTQRAPVVRERPAVTTHICAAWRGWLTTADRGCPVIPGYHRIQTRHPGGCHHCGATIPVHAVAYWRAKPSLLERLLCEACYVLLSRRRQTDEARERAVSA